MSDPLAADNASISNEAENPGQQDGLDDELFTRLVEWFRAAKDHSGPWRKKAEEDYAFVAGDQWSQEDKAVLRDQMRPTITINRTGTIIDTASGQEIQNRHELRFLPRQQGDVGVNELLTNAAKWFRDQSDAEDEETDAFRDVLICGIAATDCRLDYEDDPEGTAKDERIDPLELFWDPTAKKPNIEDRRYHFRMKQVPLMDAKELFPAYRDRPELLNAAWATNMPQGDQPHLQQEAKFYRNDQSWRDTAKELEKVTLVQAQWWDRESYHRMADPQTGKIVSISSGKMMLLQQMAKARKLPMPYSVRSTRKVYKQAFIGAEILSAGPIAASHGGTLDRFTINFITGKRDRNHNTFYGLVRAMKDPQRWANSFFSSLIHQFATSGKGVMMESSAVKNIRAFEDEYADAAAIKWVEPGAIANGKILQLKGADLNQGVSQMMEYAVNSIPQATGINVELQGTAQTDQPGILEYQRKMAGMTILADFFNNLRRFRKNQGHVLLYYIRNFFSDGRLIRIDGESGQQYVPLVRDATQAVYDVIVDEAPSSPNQKEHVWMMIMQMMPFLKGIADPMVWMALLRYSPFPKEVVDKLTQYAQQKASQPPQPSPVDQAKIAQSQSGTARNIAGAIKDLSSAGIQGPGPGEDIAKQAVASLLASGQSTQDHTEQLQQNDQAHQQQLIQAQQAHQHALQQQAQQAALTPAPQGA